MKETVDKKTALSKPKLAINLQFEPITEKISVPSTTRPKNTSNTFKASAGNTKSKDNTSMSEYQVKANPTSDGRPKT